MSEQFRCSRCKRAKGIRSFVADKSRPDNRFPWCKLCVSRYRIDKQFQDPEATPTGHVCPMDDTIIRGHTNRRFCSDKCKGRASVLRMKYNLTPQQYRSMIPADGRCPICRHKPTLWNVDHNHRTNQIMGLVCTKCNIGALASTFHDIGFVERLAAFLQNPPALAVGIDAQANPENIKSARVDDIWKRTTRTAIADDLPF